MIQGTDNEIGGAFAQLLSERISNPGVGELSETKALAIVRHAEAHDWFWSEVNALADQMVRLYPYSLQKEEQ